MNWLEMRKKAAELLLQAKTRREAITNLGDAEADTELTEIEALIAEAKALQSKADRLEALDTSIDDTTAHLDDATEPVSEIDDPEATDPDTAVRRLPATVRDTDAEERGGFDNVGDFAHAVFRAGDPSSGALDQRLAPLAAATGLQQNVGSEGGFAVPPRFVSQITDIMQQEAANLVGRTRQFPISGADSITIPGTNETSRATGSRYGGVQGYWIEEAEQVTASKPKLKKIRLEPNQVAALIYATDKLLMNGAALENWLTRAAAEELVWLMSDSIINGNGTGKPLGILNSAGRVTVAKESGQAADTVVQANIAKMWARMHAAHRQRAVWLVNQDVDPQLDLMVTVVTNVAGTENVGGFSAGLYNAERDTLKGRPIIRTEYNKTVGDEGDIILADLSAYATAFHQQGVQQAMSMHLRFDYNETAFRFMADLDGQPMNKSPLTPANGSNTLSPFVTLADRA